MSAKKPSADDNKNPTTVIANDSDNLKGTLKRIGGSQSDHWNHTLANQATQANDTDLTIVPPTTEPVTRSAAAERMRRHRERRREGMRCLLIEFRETEIDALIREGMLQPDARNDLRAVRRALYEHLDRTLGIAP